MIPEVAAVLKAAEGFVDAGHFPLVPELKALVEAVEAYRMRITRPADAVTHEETDRTWGEVITGDEILSAKTNRWYEVRNSVVDEKAGTIKINIKGSLKPIIRPIGDPVRLKRGVLGDATDTLQLIWSGITQSEHVSATGAGPMITEQEEE